MRSPHVRKISIISLIFLLVVLTLLHFVTKNSSPTVAPNQRVGNIYEAKTIATSTSIKAVEKPQPLPLQQYIKIVDSCGTAYDGECVNVRSAPNVTAPVIFRARNNLVLRVSGTVESNGITWYKLSFGDEWLRFPERVKTSMYIAARYTVPFADEGRKVLSSTTSTTSKHIIVDRSEQMLYAYDGSELFMKEKVSTGIKATPTPRGEFSIYKKTPSRYMQGPIEGISDHYYDLPGVPWNLYFTEQGAVIHGAYWHNNFGKVWSNGCVNLAPDSAEKLYHWADVGTKVLVRD